MRWGVAVALAFLLAGCGKSVPRQENQLSANEKSTAPSENAASTENEIGNNGSEPAQGSMKTKLGTLPPGNVALRFVGTWAANKAECASKPWRFSADRLTVAGGPNCSLYKVSEVAGGYDLAAQCPEKKPDPTDLIKLRFAESARAMLVESNAISPMGLIYCGK
jgi:hypothetical protein